MGKKLNMAEAISKASSITSNEIRNYTDDKVTELKKDINIERKRIDNLASLPEGSTTADAELMDIRIGADDKTYASAGEAVREQISELKEDLEDLNDTVSKIDTSINGVNINTLLSNVRHTLVENHGNVVYKFSAEKEGIPSGGTTATIRNSYNYHKRNSHCMKVSTDKNLRIGTSFISLGKTLTINENSNYGVWVYIPKSTLNVLNYIQINGGIINNYGMLSNGQVICNYPKTSIVAGWNYLLFQKPTPSFSFDGLRLWLVDIDDSTATVWHEKEAYFDSIVEGYKLKTNVLICFDNSTDKNMYEVCYKEMLKRGLVGTFAYQGGTNPDCIGTNLGFGITREHLNEMLANGWDVAQYDGYNLAQDIDDIKAYNKLLRSQGLEMTCYFPRYNDITDDIWNNYKEMGFKIIRTANSHNIIEAIGVDTYSCLGFRYDTTSDMVIEKVNDAIANNNSICILVHKVLDEKDETTSNCLLTEYRSLLDSLEILQNEEKIQCITFKELYYGGLLEELKTQLS